ncbi:hypothetical protein [Haloterrigena salifodinae]|uniref:hypothetical protein n=1 Tax=Haloterrigena salifodinae TaxID=2675099 RepID=UPI001B8706A1|nr:hypothetical protein [Haloterrigena salifodinae]
MAAQDKEPPSIEHPLLEPDFLERRLYQLKLAGTAANHHTSSVSRPDWGKPQ